MAVIPENVNLTRKIPGTDKERIGTVSVHDIYQLPPQVRKLAQYKLGQILSLILLCVGLVAFLGFFLVSGGVAGLSAGAGPIATGLWHVSDLMLFTPIHWFLQLSEYCERHR